MNIEKEISDIRGKIIFLSEGGKNIHVVEIKKGFARGGHYHKSEQIHVIMTGKIEYREKDLQTDEEKIKIFSAPKVLKVRANVAHLFIAIEDTVFAEIFDNKYESVDYPRYRKIVKSLMKD